MRKVIKTQHAPNAIGIYSQAAWAGKLLFISGQIAMLPETGRLVSDDFVEQAEQMFKN